MLNKTTVPGLSRGRSKGDHFHLVLVILLIAALFITLFPLYWMTRTAFTSPRAIVSNPTEILPPEATWGNFARVLGYADAREAVEMGGSGQVFNFFHYLGNTVLVSALITLGQVFFSSLAAYAFARLNFPFRKGLFTLFLSALMIPAIITVIPNYIFIRSLKWINTFQGIIAPYFLMSPVTVFFMRQFFLGINKELEEAALLEGAGRIRILFTIIFPLSKGALTTIALIVFTNSWNQYLWMLITGRDESVRVLTVALGIFQAQTPQGIPDWGGLMAGTMLSSLPVLLLFILFGKQLINSIGHTGVK